MEDFPKKFMTPFDCITTPEWVYMMKLMLPYTPRSLQHSLAVFLRFQEMRYTLQHFQNFSQKKQNANVLSDILPYVDHSFKDSFEQMESIMSMMEMMQNMPDMDGFDFGDLFNMKGDNSNE